MHQHRNTASMISKFIPQLSSGDSVEFRLRDSHAINNKPISVPKDPILVTDIFEELNPETDCRNALDRNLTGAEDGYNFSVSPHTTQDIIDKEIKKHIAPDKWTVGKTGPYHKISQLANPKGVIYTCEMCCQMATLCCSGCGVTYYCCPSHKSLDSGHPTMCYTLKIIRQPNLFLFDTKQRKRLAAQKLLMMETLLQNLVRRAFFQLNAKNYQYTAGALSQSLKYTSTVFGPGNDDVQKITIFIGMVEADIGLGKLKSAELSLNNALLHLWGALESNAECRLTYARGLICKAQGLLKYVSKKYHEAIYYFADFIYHISEASSPTGPRACGGYLLLGKSFLGAKQTETGLLILLFCVQLWQDYLKDLFIHATKSTKKQPLFHNNAKHEDISLPTYFKVEARQHFTELLTIVDVKEHPEIICRIFLCQGLLHYIDKDYFEAKRKSFLALELTDRLTPYHSDKLDIICLCKDVTKYSNICDSTALNNELRSWSDSTSSILTHSNV